MTFLDWLMGPDPAQDSALIQGQPRSAQSAFTAPTGLTSSPISLPGGDQSDPWQNLAATNNLRNEESIAHTARYFARDSNPFAELGGPKSNEDPTTFFQRTMGLKPQVGGPLAGVSAGTPGDITGSTRYRAQIEAAAREIAPQYGLNPEELANAMQATLEIESHGDPNAAGAMTQWGQAQGLMQVLPFHGPGRTVEQMRDPTWNIQKGGEILAQNAANLKSWEKAAAAYFGAYDWKTGQITGANDPTGQTGSGYVQQFRNAHTAVQQARAGQTAPVQIPGQASAVPATGQTINLVPDQFQISGAGDSGCGPAAITAWAAAYGRPVDPGSVVQSGLQLGVWDPQAGMTGPQGGPAGTVALMQHLGMPAQINYNVNPNEVLQRVSGNQPVIISTGAHYFFLHPGMVNAQGQYYVGQSGLAARGGAEWMSLADIQHYSPINAAIFAG